MARAWRRWEGSEELSGGGGEGANRGPQPLISSPQGVMVRVTGDQIDKEVQSIQRTSMSTTRPFDLLHTMNAIHTWRLPITYCLRPITEWAIYSHSHKIRVLILSANKLVVLSFPLSYHKIFQFKDEGLQDENIERNEEMKRLDF